MERQWPTGEGIVTPCQFGEAGLRTLGPGGNCSGAFARVTSPRIRD
jgi:hypothetical protein